MATVKEHYHLGSPAVLAPFTIKDFVCGCEFEIEDILSFGDVEHYTDIVNDGSLRDGKEFRTHPCTYEKTIELFTRLHSTLKLGKQPFSERTSIHVHVNIRELELPQARQLILLYALFEPLFFEYVGHTRKNSIFCVPLNYTYLPSIYKQSAIHLKEKWHKYTAFNIVPMGPGPEAPGFGTVEFRHLYGTNNVEVFQTWLSAIKELYIAIALNPGFNILKAIEGDIVELAHATIPTLARRHSAEYIREICADTLLDVKLSGGGIR
jgi:hypothetical protein